MRLLVLFLASIIIILLLAIFPIKSKADTAAFQLVCVNGFQFVMPGAGGSLTEVFSDNNYVTKCQMS